MQLIRSGKVREVYGEEQDVIVVASDRVSVYDVVLPTPIPDKGGRPEAHAVSGEFVSPVAGRITVGELANDYRDSGQGQVSIRAGESDESALRVHSVPALAGCRSRRSHRSRSSVS